MPDGEAFAYLETLRIPHTVELLIKVEALARSHGYQREADGAHEINIGLLRDVNLVAVEIAGLADGEIIKRILQTHNRVQRPTTGTMESHIISDVGPLGLVRVALIDDLNRIINPNGYGPFWRAQEYGTGGEVPSQVGRQIFGTFEPSGEPPQSEQAGQGVGHDIAFIPQGQNPGEGRINVELPARHFLTEGSAAAAVVYKQRMGDVQAKWSARIKELIAAVDKRDRRGSFVGIIKA